MNRNLIKISKFRSISALYLQRSQIHYSYSFEKEKMPTAVNMQQPRFLVSLDPEHPHAKAPTRGSALAAGYDLYASQNVIIPKGSYGRVAPRSGLGECIYSSSLITNMVQFLT
jgi:dUTPase